MKRLSILGILFILVSISFSQSIQYRYNHYTQKNDMILNWNAIMDSIAKYSGDTDGLDTLYIQYECDPEMISGFGINGDTIFIDTCYATIDYVNDAIAQHIFDPDASVFVNGTEDNGTVDSCDYHDGELWEIGEVVGSPGINVEIIFDSVDHIPNRITFHGYYDGSPLHDISLQMWDYEEAEWEVYHTLDSRSTMEWIEISIPDPAEHIQNDSCKLRFYHSSAGNTSHELYVDYLVLSTFGFGSTSDHGALTGLTDDDHDIYPLLTGRTGDHLHIDTISDLTDSASLILKEYDGGGSFKLIAQHGDYWTQNVIMYGEPETGLNIEAPNFGVTTNTKFGVISFLIDNIFVSSFNLDSNGIFMGNQSTRIDTINNTLRDDENDLPTSHAVYDWVGGQGYLITEIDGDISNEGKLTVKNASSTSAAISSNTTSSTDVEIKGGGIISITENTILNTITITGTEVDGSKGNEGDTTAYLTNGFGLLPLSYNQTQDETVDIDTAIMATNYYVDNSIGHSGAYLWSINGMTKTGYLTDTTYKIGVGTQYANAMLHVDGSIYTKGGSGDFDGDGEVFASDLDWWLNGFGNPAELNTSAEFARLDIDGNGEVNLTDGYILSGALYPDFDLEDNTQDSARLAYRVIAGAMHGTINDSTYAILAHLKLQDPDSVDIDSIQYLIGINKDGIVRGVTKNIGIGGDSYWYEDDTTITTDNNVKIDYNFMANGQVYAPNIEATEGGRLGHIVGWNNTTGKLLPYPISNLRYLLDSLGNEEPCYISEFPEGCTFPSGDDLGEVYYDQIPTVAEEMTTYGFLNNCMGYDVSGSDGEINIWEERGITGWSKEYTYVIHDMNGCYAILGYTHTGFLLPDTTAEGDNLGNHTATENLKMDFHDVTDVKRLNIMTTTDTGGYITFDKVIAFHNFGEANIFAGLGAGNMTSTGLQSVGIGNNALKELTEGNGNTAVGYDALTVNTSGANNTAVGQNALELHESGEQNVAVGSNVLTSIVTGNHNTAIGTLALQNTTNSNNVALGYSAGKNYLGGYRLFIDSEPFDSEEEDSTLSLLFGNFLTDKLTVNGDLHVTGDISGSLPSSVLEWSDTTAIDGVGISTFDALRDTALAIREDFPTGGGWTGTATSDLDMNDYSVVNVDNIGIGVASPTAAIEVVHEEGSAKAPINIIGYYSASATAGQTLNKVARGTASSPSAVQAGDIMGGFAGRGYGATGFSSSARVQAVGCASETWTDAAHGTYFRVTTTPIGSTTPTESFRVTGNGVGINTITNDKALEVNSATGDNLRLTYSDADGTALYKTDFDVSSSGDLSVRPSGQDMILIGNLNLSDSNIVNVDSLEVQRYTRTEELRMDSPIEFIRSHRREPFYYNDFMYTNAAAYLPWYGLAIGGQTTSVSAIAEHPGILEFRSATSGTNTGYALRTNTSSLLLDGKMYTEAVFKVNVTTNSTIYFGFQNTTTSAEPTMGAYIKITGTTLEGKTVNGGVPSATATNYTITQGTWYRMEIYVSSDKATIYYKLYDMTDAIVWSNTLTTTIPTGVFLHGIQATNSGTSQYVLHLDYMAVSFGECTR